MWWFVLVPNRELPSDAGWSSTISRPVLEFRIIEIFFLPDLILFISQILTKSMLFPNPKPDSFICSPENDAGTAPVAISTYLHNHKTTQVYHMREKKNIPFFFFCFFAATQLTHNLRVSNGQRFFSLLFLLAT